VFVFGSFRLDVANASLRRGKHAIFLTPKALNVLRYLVEHAGQLVTKDDLWRAVWPGVSVTDATLSVCMSKVRKTLGDDSKTPRYIETVHRLGYRFIAPVSTQSVGISRSAVRSQESVLARGPQSANPHFVGRDAEMARLHEWWERALAGERQIVFVTGEPGIGKTTLVEEFLGQEQVSGEAWIGRGQCIEHYGIGEAYFPLLDALTRLCREPGGGRMLELLDKHAPAWLVQMPALVGAAELEKLAGKTAGANHARMLRELADATEVISQERPLVLRLEDLHWSDYSTLEWLGFLARRKETARLLVLGTYRPVEVIVREHPLKNLKEELQIHGESKELPLPLLSEAAVMEYLALRFAGPFSSNSSASQQRGEGAAPEPLRKLAHTIYQRTDGNPLFMVNVAHYLAEREVLKTPRDGRAAQSADALVADGVDTPPSIVQMIERNLERLNPDEQAVLEAASVAGNEFPAAAVAAALKRRISEIEACCTRLSRQQQFVHLRGIAEWPDGTVAASFEFLHGLYRDILYDRVSPGRRVELHRLVAECEETAWGERAAEIATELAHHYRKAGKTEHAIGYLERAGKAAESRHAFKEAQASYEQALALLSLLPDSPGRDIHELDLRQSIFWMHRTTSWITSPESVDAYARAIALAKRSGKLSQVISMMYTTGQAAINRGDFETAATLADQALELALPEANPTNLGLAYGLQLFVRQNLGDPAGIEEYFARGLKFFSDAAIWPLPLVRLSPFGAASWNAWALGRFNLAQERLARVMAEANQNNPVEVVWSECMGAVSYILLRENERAETLAVRALELAEKHQMPQFVEWARCLLGLARARLGRASEGVGLIRQGLAGLAAIGTRNDAFILFLAESQALSGDIGDALKTIEQVLRPDHAAPPYRGPEAFRLRGDLHLRQGQHKTAEADFRTALTQARNMGAKSLELRAATNLARLLRDTGRRDEAHSMLAEIYNWFTEGFNTADLKEAKALLDELTA
jgi:DNA-binding winged helix-turn-helix (wHTH) protein/tetratricopeptide (TPR) repeat protein